MRHYRDFAPLVALALLLPLAACDDDDDPMEPEPDPAIIRVVNVAEGTADVEVLGPGSTTPLAMLDFGQMTNTCVEVPAGDQTIAFSSGEEEIASVEADLAEGERYLLVLVSNGAGDDVRAVIGSDEVTASAGNNALRLINATSTVGDVFVTPPDEDPAAQFLVAGNISPLASSNLTLDDPYHRSTAHTRVRLFADGETIDPLSDITLTGLPGSRVATVVFTEEGVDAEDRAFLVFPCQ